MAKHAVHLAGHFKPAMRSIAWNSVQVPRTNKGRLYILIYCNIAYDLKKIERSIRKPSDLLQFITSAAQSLAFLSQPQREKGEDYYIACVYLHIFVKAYLEMYESSAHAYTTIRQIGELQGCLSVARILNNEQLE